MKKMRQHIRNRLNIYYETKINSEIPYFQMWSYKMPEPNAAKLLNDIIDDLLQTTEIINLIDIYCKQHLKSFEGDHSRDKLYVSSKNGFRFAAHNYAQQVFCRLPDPLFTRIQNLKISHSKNQVSFEVIKGFYETFYTCLIMHYLILALDTKNFPHYGLKYENFKDLIKKLLRSKTFNSGSNDEKKTLWVKKKWMADYRKACWENLPIRIRSGYKKYDFPIFGDQFSDADIVSARKWVEAHLKDMTSASTNSIAELKECLLWLEKVYDHAMNGSFGQQHPMSEVIAYLIIKGLKPAIEEYEKGEINCFVKEWAPILKRVHGDFLNTKLLQRRWIPSLDGDPVKFFKKGLTIFLHESFPLNRRKELLEPASNATDEEFFNFSESVFNEPRMKYSKPIYNKKLGKEFYSIRQISERVPASIKTVHNYFDKFCKEKKIQCGKEVGKIGPQKIVFAEYVDNFVHLIRKAMNKSGAGKRRYYKKAAAGLLGISIRALRRKEQKGKFLPLKDERGWFYYDLDRLMEYSKKLKNETANQ